MRTPAWLLAGTLASLFPAAAQARSERLEHIDPAASQTRFSLRVAWVRKIEGEFAFIKGEVLHQAGSEHFDVDIAIATQSLGMDNPDHAAWARSAEFFDAERHPWIRFRARDVPEQLLIDGGRLIGWLSVRGIERAADFALLPARCARPGIDCAVEAEGAINRSEFGLNARRWVVSDKVQLQLQFRLRQASGDTVRQDG